MTAQNTPPHRLRRPSTGHVLLAAAAACLLVVSVSGALSGLGPGLFFPAAGATGAMSMRESSGAVSCSSTGAEAVSIGTSTCAELNEMGGDLAMFPGRVVTTAITVANTGSARIGFFVLHPEGPCAQKAISRLASGSAADLCAMIRVTITSGGRIVFAGTAADLGTARPGDLSMPAAPTPGAAVGFVFRAMLDPAAGNTYQGIGASLPLAWSFSS